MTIESRLEINEEFLKKRIGGDFNLLQANNSEPECWHNSKSKSYIYDLRAYGEDRHLFCSYERLTEERLRNILEGKEALLGGVHYINKFIYKI